MDLRSLKVTRRKGDAKPQFVTPSAASSAASPYPSAEVIKENAENSAENTPKKANENAEKEKEKEKTAEENAEQKKEREREEEGEMDAFAFPRKSLADLSTARKNPVHPQVGGEMFCEHRHVFLI